MPVNFWQEENKSWERFRKEIRKSCEKLLKGSIFIKQLQSHAYLCPYIGSFITKYVKYVNETMKEIKYSGQEENKI